MKRILMAVAFAFLLATMAPAANMLLAPNDMGVSMGHVHMIVPDVEAAKKFWLELGGAPAKLGPNEVLKFSGVVVMLRQGEPTGGSIGSSVNHICFTVRNVEESIGKFKAAGLHTLPLNPNTPGQGFLFTPGDLVRVELLEDAALPVPIAFNHVHFNLIDPGPDGKSSISAMQAWYAKVFGAKPGMRKEFQAGDIPGANLTFAKAGKDVTSLAPTKGRAVDHIGFEVKKLEAFCKKAEANGVKFDTPFTKRPELGITQAFLTDAWGNYIELTEGLDRL